MFTVLQAYLQSFVYTFELFAFVMYMPLKTVIIIKVSKANVSMDNRGLMYHIM